ncbi:MAG: methyltransferase domain-containing protein [Candidatus Jordarchaeales archaeon]
MHYDADFEKELERRLEPLRNLKNYEAWLSWFKNAEKRAEVYILKMKPFLKQISGLTVLDVGCGIGGACLALANLANLVVGIEINPLAIPLAKLKAKKAVKGAIDFILASGLNMPFRRGSFNLVICNDVLEHVDDKDKLLKEINSVLAKNGHLFLTTPNKLYPVEPHTGMFGLTLLPRRIANKIASLKFKMNADLPSLVTYKELVKLLTKNSFSHLINHPDWLLYENTPLLRGLTRVAKIRPFLWFLTLFSPIFTVLAKKWSSSSS